MTQATLLREKARETAFVSLGCAHGSAAILLLVFSMSTPAQEPDAAAELENIRALPYGFYVQCEDKDLKIRKKGTATFVIRNSVTCNRLRQLVEKQYRDDFTLCSNDPNHLSVPPDTKTIKCVELQIDDLEI